MAGASLLVGVAPAGAGGSLSTAGSCRAAAVHYTPYPGGAPGLGSIPWVRGTPAAPGLVGLLWYWPEAWRTRHLRQATMYTGGAVPGGRLSTKILWVFLGRRARAAAMPSQVVVAGRRLDGPGRSWQRFVVIGYAGQDGAPSYASIVDLPTPGCWRLDLTAGRLRAAVIFRAIPS